MSKVEQALKSAIEAMIMYQLKLDSTFIDEAIISCKSALSDIENCEVVAEVRWRNGEMFAKFKTDFVEAGTKLYTSPQPRDWVEIADEQAYKCISDNATNSQLELVRDVEAKCKQLNTKG